MLYRLYMSYWAAKQNGPHFWEPLCFSGEPRAYFSAAQARWMRVQASVSSSFEVA